MLNMADSKTRRILFLFCLTLSVEITLGITNIDPEKKEMIDEFINSLLFDCDKHNVVGMNLAVVYNGETLYTTGYGLRNLGESKISKAEQNQI